MTMRYTKLTLVKKKMTEVLDYGIKVHCLSVRGILYLVYIVKLHSLTDINTIDIYQNIIAKILPESMWRWQYG